MSTHLLYLYATDPLDGLELRYSLRSVQANLHLRSGHPIVTVVGDPPPAWLHPDHYLPGNPYPDKVRNMMHNVAQGCEHLSPEAGAAYFMADDYLLLEPTEEILPICWGPIADHLAAGGVRRLPWYRDALTAAWSYLGGEFWVRSWELHRPLPLDTTAGAKVLREAELTGVPMLWRTVYGNAVGYPDRPIHRMPADLDGRAGPSSVPWGSTWVSTDTPIWGKRSFRETITRAFPTPSRWER